MSQEKIKRTHHIQATNAFLHKIHRLPDTNFVPIIIHRSPDTNAIGFKVPYKPSLNSIHLYVYPRQPSPPQQHSHQHSTLTTKKTPKNPTKILQVQRR